MQDVHVQFLLGIQNYISIIGYCKTGDQRTDFINLLTQHVHYTYRTLKPKFDLNVKV